ncbi:uncharacterized protein METZ01_LOCUS353040, partial [marine metagenome]
LLLIIRVCDAYASPYTLLLVLF